MDMLVNGEGYQIEFVEDVSGEETALRSAISRDHSELRRITFLPGGGLLYWRDEYNAAMARIGCTVSWAIGWCGPVFPARMHMNNSWTAGPAASSGAP
ncbi:hypothetical protein [Ascidiaceihabitans sp.]|uniref:hypothetical protein n=2 Tax=Ascidiaceihabitans sp. TaxID=1872644 RepID=UPI0032968639